MKRIVVLFISILISGGLLHAQQIMLSGQVKDGSDNVLFVAHNAGFDMSVIRECCKYYGMNIPNVQSACSLKAAKQAWQGLKCYKLTYLAEKFGIEYDAHNALDDARTCGMIYAVAMSNS